MVRTRPAPESLQAGHDIYAMLKAYKIENPHITKTYIWLDGAGNLHNAALLALFADSEAHTGATRAGEPRITFPRQSSSSSFFGTTRVQKGRRRRKRGSRQLQTSSP